jgi:peptidyl-prolyl cis-trans isomerase C
MKRKQLGMAIGAVGLMTVVAGCGTTVKSASSTPVATVQNVPITSAQLANFVSMTEFFQGQPLPTTAQEKSLEVKALVQQTAVNQWALAHHLITQKKAASQAKSIISSQIESQVGGAKGLTSLLKSKKLSMGTLDTYVTDQMITQSAFTYATKSVKAPSTAQEQAYYNQNKSTFANPPQDEINDIVVKTQTQAKSILNQLLHGANFAQLAKKDSTASTAKSGGSLGYLPVSPTGGMSQGMYTAVQSMKPGQYTTYHGSQGYHVIQLVATKPASTQAFSAVQSQIKQSLLTQSQDAAYQAFAAKIQKSMKVTIGK